VEKKNYDRYVFWRKRTVLRIFLELSSFIVPLVFISIGIITIINIKSNSKNIHSLTCGNLDYKCIRVKNQGNDNDIIFWGPLVVTKPAGWCYAFTEKAGGMTLTFVPGTISNLGIHIQLSELNTDVDIDQLNRAYLNNAGVPISKCVISEHNGIKIYTFNTCYWTSHFIKTQAKFVFFKKNKYWFKFIYFSPSTIFKEYESVFSAVLSSVKFNISSSNE